MEHKKIETQFFDLLPNDPEKAFKLIFEGFYSYLCIVVYRMIPDKGLSEDISQEVYYDFWRKKDNIQIKTSLKAYLHRAAVNKTLNHIRDKKLKFSEESEAAGLKSLEADILQELNVRDLQKRINKAVEALPERCRIIFSLSRFEEMTYKEIALNLNISVKTVENQMTKALRILRERIKE